MFRFPYGNLHGFNLDWLLNEWKKFQESFTRAFTASVNTIGVDQPASVDVTYDKNTGVYNFGFDLPDYVKPLTFQIGYTSSNSGTVIPTGVTWQDTPPFVASGDYLWTRCLTVYNNGQNFATYSVARQGVDGQGSPSTSLPIMDGSASIGVSNSFARADHVHPTDTSRLGVNALTYVTPFMDGTATAGASSQVARADHVHPNDTSKISVSAFSQATPAMDGVGSAGSSLSVARDDHVHPTDTSRASESDLQALSGRVDDAEDDITALQGDITALQGDVANLEYLVQMVDGGTLSTNTSGYYNGSIDATKTGYTPIGVVGYTMSTTFVYIPTIHIGSGTDILIEVRNSGQGVISFNPKVWVLYQKERPTP